MNIKSWQQPNANPANVTGRLDIPLGKPRASSEIGAVNTKPRDADLSLAEAIDNAIYYGAIEAKTDDMVHKPSHYQVLPGVEVIDIRKAILSKINSSPSLFAVDCWSRSWEYLTRMWGKNDLEDARKALVYLQWLIEEMERVEKVKK